MTHDETEYHRNKALGNTWHVPTAAWLLFNLLLNTLAQPAASVCYSPIRATALWLANSVPFGPPPKASSHQPPTVLLARTFRVGHRPGHMPRAQNIGSNSVMEHPTCHSIPPGQRVPQTSSRRDPPTRGRERRTHQGMAGIITCACTPGLHRSRTHHTSAGVRVSPAPRTVSAGRYIGGRAVQVSRPHGQPATGHQLVHPGRPEIPAAQIAAGVRAAQPQIHTTEITTSLRTLARRDRAGGQGGSNEWLIPTIMAHSDNRTHRL